MKDNYSDHLFIFDAEDVNDQDLDIIIECLKEHLPNFNVFYGDGNMLNFRWDDKKGEKIEKNYYYSSRHDN